ncbi:hypothetical protein SNOD_12775 [Streptomyces nodosus]|uniref:Uncharacterized protein n=1 Tax=Streptomyces nodosus TaxID=40318 RepID=A0A0B5DLE0_9ACTN|nr:hypothetical protein SNOD_12775 [Streptomyces nodosus]
MSGATSQRGERWVAVVRAGRTAGTVTVSPGPWPSSGGTARVRAPRSSRSSSGGSRRAVPGAVNSSIRPRCVATGPEPGPSSQSRSSIRRPKTAGALTTSNAVPQGRTTGTVGRLAQSARVPCGWVPAEASQAAPSEVTSETSNRSGRGARKGSMNVVRLLMPVRCTRSE